MARRCTVHDLAAGPDGKCVLCHRATSRGAGATTRRLGIGVGVAIVAAIGVAAFALRSGRAPLTESGSRVVAEPSSEEALPALPAEPETVPEPVFEPEPERELVAAPERSATVAAAPDDLRAAMRRVQVTLYSTSWCPHCDRARKWLQASSVSFTERDVERDADAQREHRRLNPRGGVPTLDIDGRAIVGFHPATTERALHEAARARRAR